VTAGHLAAGVAVRGCARGGLAGLIGSVGSFSSFSSFSSIRSIGLIGLVVVQSAWAQSTLPAGPASPTLANAAHAGVVPDPAKADPKAWLQRIQTAAARANYRGTLVTSAGGAMTSSRVLHCVVGDNTYEMLESLDGKQQRMLRHNDSVHTLWPQTKLAVQEKRETLAAWSTTPQAVDPQALEHYALRHEASARLAGRDADVFVLEPRDTLRYAQRLWADRESALLLRADVLGTAATLIESTAFSSVDIGIKPQPDVVLQAMQRVDGYRVLRPQQRITQLEAHGWLLARPVPGFKRVGSVLRGMENLGASAGGIEPVLQTVFTDGITHVSLFAEPYQEALHRAESQHQQGATASLTLRRGEHWFTAVGDVPLATLKLFALALDRRSP
jgi:sigma-E factor negative regulatory protein RseB